MILALTRENVSGPAGLELVGPKQGYTLCDNRAPASHFMSHFELCFCLTQIAQAKPNLSDLRS